MDYFIIAGEASGDLHGARLMRSLKAADPEAAFRVFGGELMAAEGGVLLKHYREMAFMGFFEVVSHLRTINRNMTFCREQLLHPRPDVLILIDYPGFNLKVAAYARSQGIPVFYYILPKVWAWKAWRTRKLKLLEGLYSIFPFEREFFRRHGVETEYSGNPLTEMVAEASRGFRSRERFLSDNGLRDMPLVALLPGSRVQEIRLMLPVMSRLAAGFPDYQFAVAASQGIDPALYGRYTAGISLPLLCGQTYELLHHARAALVTSGTATLETALLKTPQAVLYKMAGGKTGYRLFRFLFLKVDYISLPNLVAGREIVREFVMDRMKSEIIKPELLRLLEDQACRDRIGEGYREVEARLGGVDACRQTAGKMVSRLKSIKKDNG